MSCSTSLCVPPRRICDGRPGRNSRPGRNVAEQRRQGFAERTAAGGRLVGVLAQQVRVLRCAASQLAVDLAAVDLGHVAVGVEYGEDDAAVELAVARLAEDADLLQPRAELHARFELLVRERQGQGPVGKADLETVDGFGVVGAALSQVGLRAVVSLESAVVEVDDFFQQRLVVGRWIEVERFGGG